MKCPECKNIIIVTWPLYFKNPFGPKYCPNCNVSISCHHRWFYWPLLFLSFLPGGIPLSILVSYIFGNEGIIIVFIIGGLTSALPIDKYLEQKFGIVKIKK